MSWLMRVPDVSGIQVVGVEITYFNAQQYLTCAIPSGIQEGDLMVFTQISVNALGGPLNMTSSPLNYTYVGQTSAASSPRVFCYRKIAAAGETARLISQSGSNYYVVIIAAYRGATTVQQFSSLHDGTSPYTSTSLTIGTTPGIVSVYAGARAAVNAANSPGSCVVDAPYEPNELYSHATAAGRGVLAHIRSNSTGTYGNYGLTWSNSVANTVSALLEIR